VLLGACSPRSPHGMCGRHPSCCYAKQGQELARGFEGVVASGRACREPASWHVTWRITVRGLCLQPCYRAQGPRAAEHEAARGLVFGRAQAAEGGGRLQYDVAELGP